MADMLWSAANGYLASPNLSHELRMAVQPLSRFRQFADVEEVIGKNAGDVYNWNVFGNATGGAADGVIGTVPDTDNSSMPEGQFAIGQGSVKMHEAGLALPFTGRLDQSSEFPIKEIIHKTLKNDAAKKLDRQAYNAFNSTRSGVVINGASTLAIWEAGETGSDVYSATSNGVTGSPAASAQAAMNAMALSQSANTINGDLNTTSVKKIVLHMEERNIPVFDGENYVCIGRPAAFEQLQGALETLSQYVNEGYGRILSGEIGRYAGVRFVKQTNVPSELSRSSNATNAQIQGFSANRDSTMFFGADTVVECVAVPEEMRAKIPGDYGRSKGIAWYYMGAFACIHANSKFTAQSRIIKVSGRNQ